MFEFDHTAEEAISFMASISVPENQRAAYMEKKAVGMGFVIPTALGIGAAGTAGYMGMREAEQRAKIKALTEINDPNEREVAKHQIDRGSLLKAAPAALGAGAAAGYLTGAHLPEKYWGEGAEALKGFKEKALYGPGKFFQKGVHAGGGSHAIGRGVASVAGLGAGILAGSMIGKSMGDKAVEDAKERLKARRGMSKSAGLFLKPSDLADSHHDLGAALEGRLNANDSGQTFKKQAGRGIGAASGAVAGLVYEPVRQRLRKPIEQPKPQQPKGSYKRLKHYLAKKDYEADQWARKNPAAAALTMSGAGAAAGAAANFGSGPIELSKTLRRKT